MSDASSKKGSGKTAPFGQKRGLKSLAYLKKPSTSMLGFLPDANGLHNPEKRPRFYHPILMLGSVIAIYFGGKFFSLVLSMLYPAIYGKSGIELRDFFYGSTIAQFVHLFAIQTLILGLLYAVTRPLALRLKDVGLVRPKVRDAVYAVLGFGYYFPAVLFIGHVVSRLVPSFNVEHRQFVGFENAYGQELILVYIALAVLPPLAEEILFRGFLYTGLRSRLGVWLAAILTSVLFAAAHLSGSVDDKLLWVAALDTFVLSLVLIYLRQKTGSLWASIGLHCIKNSFAFVTLFIYRF